MASYDARNKGDIDGVLSLYASDVEWFPDASFPEARPLRGREAVRRWFTETGSAWVNVHNEVSEVITVEDGRVLVRGDWGGEGVASGIETSSGVTGIFTIRDGLIARVEWYFDHDKALEAAGLAD